MKKLTGKELLKLNWGDSVYRWANGQFTSFRFVGLMPTSPENYAIFSNGEELTHCFVDDEGEIKYSEWYVGEYNSEFVDKLKLSRLCKKMDRHMKRLSGGVDNVPTETKLREWQSLQNGSMHMFDEETEEMDRTMDKDLVELVISQTNLGR